MGAKKRQSNGKSDASKVQKTGQDAKLPSIPADSTKLPHMKIFNEWLFFV